MTSTIDRPTTPVPFVPAPRRVVVRRLADPAPVPRSVPGHPEHGTADPPPTEATRTEPSGTEQAAMRARLLADPPESTARAEAHLVLRLVFEVLEGRRPHTHLAGVLTDRVRRYVSAAIGRLDRQPGPLGPRRRARGRQWARADTGQAARLRSMRVCHPAAGVAEVSAVWQYRGRSRALAARFELAAPAVGRRSVPAATNSVATDSAATITGPPGPTAARRPAEASVAGPAGVGRPRWHCVDLRLG